MEIFPGSLSIAHENDATLVELARSGERSAFGLLYLRHHEAAWRVANAVTAFSAESAGVVIEAFSRVLGSPLHRLERDAVLRPALLSCVRQVALERGVRPGPVHRPSSSNGATGVAPAEIVLPAVEPAVAEAFQKLEEARRTALWLTAIEALTPNEVGRIMRLLPERAATLAVEARHDLCRTMAGIFATEGSRSCREAAPYVAGIADHDAETHPDLAEHLAGCPVCGMRRAEAADLPAALRDAIPPSPLLGRPCQRRWLGQKNLRNRRGAVLKTCAVVVLAALLTALLLTGWPRARG